MTYTLYFMILYIYIYIYFFIIYDIFVNGIWKVGGQPVRILPNVREPPHSTDLGFWRLTISSIKLLCTVIELCENVYIFFCIPPKLKQHEHLRVSKL